MILKFKILNLIISTHSTTKNVDAKMDVKKKVIIKSEKIRYEFPFFRLGNL